MNRKQRRAASRRAEKGGKSPANTAAVRRPKTGVRPRTPELLPEAKTGKAPVKVTLTGLLKAGVQHQQSGRLAEAEACYKRVLAERPDNADALHLLGLAAHQLKRHDEAADLINRAIAQDGPGTPVYLGNFASMLFEQGKYEQAVECYDKTLKLEPHHAEAYRNRAVALAKLKRFDEALSSYDEALALNPADIQSLKSQGVLLGEAGRHEEALACCEKLLALKPDHVGAYNNRAIALDHLKKYEEALASYDRALELKPANVDTLNNKGNTLQKLGRLDDALSTYEKALALSPGHASSLNNKGIVLRKLGRHDEALSYHDKALSISPHYAEAHSNRGMALYDLKRFDEALASFDKALAIKPDDLGALSGRSNVLREFGRREEALACCEKLLSLNPNHLEAYVTQAVILSDLRQFDAAFAAYERATSIDPNFATAHWNELLLHLTLGNFERGWAKHEWRWDAAVLGVPKREFSQPAWVGHDSIEGKRIFVYNEQGLGDAIQFCRYIPLLAAKGAQVIVEVIEPLRRLMSGLTGVAQCISSTEKLPEFDYHCSINSLPIIFKTRLETIPSATPYLQTPAQTSDWETRLGPKDRPRIGLVWSGNPKHGNDKNRSASLRAFLPLLDIDATFVSLQKDVRPDDQAMLKELSDTIIDLGPSLNDFADTAALISHLDLVICVDTSVAHLAGALGKPVWILLPFTPDWRWMLDRDDSPWYPNARLFRQDENREWPSVIGRMQKALGEFVEKQRSAGPRAVSLARTKHAALAASPKPQNDEPSAEDVLAYAAELVKQKKYEEALSYYDKAVALKPEDALVFVRRANLLNELKKYDEALSSYDQALLLRPDFAAAYNDKGNLLRKLNRMDEALANFDKASALLHNNEGIFYNKALVYLALGRTHEALAHFDRALTVRANFPEAINGRGLALRDLKRFDEALACFEKLIAIDPNNANAHWNESRVRRLLGDFERGWAKVEWRWKASGLNLWHRNFKQPLWLGNEPVNGKRILLHSDEGLGDAIQFCRYAPLLAAQGAYVIVEVQEPLQQIVSGLAGVSQCVPRGAKLPDFDLHCPTSSLPLAFKTRLEAIPSATPYLHAPAHTESWEMRLGRKDRPRIGLVWSGNPAYGNDRDRSVGLRSLLLLLDIDATFVSLQKDVRPGDQALLNERKDILHLGPSLKNFADTAAVISKLDLVISVDTAVAHLAGALGKPVWILLPFIPDWRWLLDREDSPWYPTARLFRQDDSRKWPGVIEQVRAALFGFVAERQKSLLGTTVAHTRIKETEINDCETKGQREFEQTSAITTANGATAELLKTGLKHFQSGRPAEAETCYRHVLNMHPAHADALHMLGLVFYQTKRPDAAVDLINQAIAENGPSTPIYLTNLGVVLVSQGKYENALEVYDRVLALKPDHSDAHRNRAIVLTRLNRFEEALVSYDKLVALKPDDAKAWFDRANALSKLRKFGEALENCDKALALKPDYIEAINGRSAILRELGRFDEALACCDELLTLKPGYPDAYNTHGTVLRRLNRNAEALASFDRAIELSPNFGAALNNRGNALQKLGRLDEALLSYDKALLLNPNDLLAMNNRTAALIELNRFDEALAGFTKTQSLDPNNSDAHWNESLVRLTLGDFERGLAEYEWRWKIPQFNHSQIRNLTQPYWLGKEPIEGKRILIYNEQGFGDAIQFCRYIPLLAAQGAHVIVQIDEALRPLMSILTGVAQCVVKGVQLPAFDVHCSVNSLPLAFKTKLETIPFATPYVSAPALPEDWEKRLGPKDRPRIGLVWSGRQTPNPNRSVALRLLAPLFEIDATFVGLQKDVLSTDEGALKEFEHIIHFGPSLRTFADTAAVISHLDLVISIDTAVAHLAGALGKPVWVLLPFVPDWRWLLDREDSPWYPTARLFRQNASREWESVIERVRETLDEFVAIRTLTGSAAAKRTSARTAPSKIISGNVDHSQKIEIKLPSRPQRKSDDLRAAIGLSEPLKEGLQHHQAGRMAEAEASYRRLLADQPEHPGALHLLGVVAYQSKRPDDAVRLIRRAIAINAQDPAYFSNLGLALHALGKYAEAIDSYDKALALKRDYVDAHNNRAITLAKLRRFEEALASYDKALIQKPDHLAAIVGRGIALRELRRYDDALAYFGRALALKPDYSEAHNGRGIVLEILKRFDEALTSFDRALALEPGHVAARINRGNVLRRLERIDEAIANYNEALSLEPNNLTALANRGWIMAETKRFDEAFANYEKAISIDPNYAVAHWNEANNRLLLGNLQRGWAKAEWRWKVPTLRLAAPNASRPSWLGDEPIKGKRILLYNEQGFGDAIQFCRYVPLVAAQGAEVIVQVQEPLRQLVSGLPGVAQCIAKGDKLPAFDVQCSINSLPLAFKTRLETIPSATPYLHPPAQTSDWEARLGPKGRPRIGLVWSGRPTHVNDRNRSAGLAAFLPLLQVDATFVTLQKDVRTDDQALLNERKDIVHLGPSLKNFADTAAVISHLDVVISVDTAVAHLAGALGKAVWILLPYFPDWRWLLDREDSPWYPTARLFRQDESRAWPNVIARVRAALSEFVGSSMPSRKRLTADIKFETTQKLKLAHKPNETLTRASISKLLEEGKKHYESGRLAEAETCLQSVLAAQPDNPTALNLLGLVAHKSKQHDRAIDLFGQAIAKDGQEPSYWTNLGLTFFDQGKNENALECHEKALVLKPDYAAALVNLGIAQANLKKFGDALSSYEKATAVDSNSAFAHWNECLLRLQLGDFERGWEKFEWRWKLPDWNLTRRFTKPAWLGGESVHGRRILIYNEQGFGDAIYFCRYLPLLAQQGAQVILEIQEPLRELMTSLAGVSQCVAVKKIVPEFAERVLPAFDVHCSVASLPLVFKTTLETIPSTVPYLHPPARAHEWRKRLGPKDRPRIGLVWSGNPNYLNDANRSASLSAFLPLLNVDATFVSLQKEPRADDQALLNARKDILNLDPSLKNFADTAAVISQLDLVISVDTAVAHLAGALGKPVWVLLPYVPDWRWLLDRDDSPWYPTARLFRQDESRAWPSVIERVGAALSEFVGNRKVSEINGHNNTNEQIHGEVEISLRSVANAAISKLLKAGVELHRSGRLTEAEAYYRRVLAARPDHADGLHLLGLVAHQSKRSDEAVDLINQAVNNKGSNNAVYLTNLGLILFDQGLYDKALDCCDRAITTDPDNADAHTHRGLALTNLRRFDEALASYARAQSIDPNHAEAQWDELLLQLLLGDFKRGFAKYEWRWRRTNWKTRLRHFTQPTWLGKELIKGKRILIYNEQGFGDAIQFCRYIPLLAAQGAHVIVQIDAALRPLMSTLTGVAQCLAKDKQLPAFDLHTSVNSLPLAFKTELKTIPSAAPYLTSPIRSDEWEKRFGSKNRHRIGLVWSGSPTHGNDRNRSSSLRAYLPLLDLDATFISLQKDTRPDDEALLKERKDILNLGPAFKNFADTAAVISQLDLVISVDTAVAHLAGALGKPVWVLLPFVPDWRWLLDRDDSPWYPTARLFRQDDSRAWLGVIDRVRAALREFIKKQQHLI